MFGKEVWPDDFYTYSSGQKVMYWSKTDMHKQTVYTEIRQSMIRAQLFKTNNVIS